MYRMAYNLHSVRIHDEVWERIKADGRSVNQLVKLALAGVNVVSGGAFDTATLEVTLVEASPVRARKKPEKVVEPKSDPRVTVTASGRTIFRRNG